MKESKVNKGRIGVWVPEHPKGNNRGYVLRSRYNMEQYLGRYLDTEEIVHHCDGNKFNDDIENLDLILNSEHTRHHFNAGDVGRGRKLDYDKIKELRLEGLGYKKIAKIIGSNRGSVRSAVKFIENGNKWG